MKSTSASNSALWVFTLCARWSSAGAWSPHGHKNIAKIAHQFLKDSPRGKKDIRRIRDMFGGDLEEFVNFEQDVLIKSKITKEANWHRQSPEWTCSTGIGSNGKLFCDGAAADYLSLLCIVADTFNQYTHDGLLEHFDPPEKSLFLDPTAKKQMETWIHYLHQEGDGQATKSELRTLQILIGDMHQPLHWLAKNDYGEKVTVTFRGKKHTLRSFWEEYIPKHVEIKPMELSRSGGIERGAARYGNYEDKFVAWTKEVSKKACTDIDGVVGETNQFEVTEEQFQKWLELAKDLTLKAGNRLATVLYAILEHKKSKEHEKHGRGFLHDHALFHKGRGIGTNICVAVVLVPALLLFFVWHDSEGYKINMFPKIGRFLE